MFQPEPVGKEKQNLDTPKAGSKDVVADILLKQFVVGPVSVIEIIFLI